MKRRAMAIIMAISCTGTLMTFRKRSPFSSPSVRLLGVVVRVMMEAPMRSMHRRIAMVRAIRRPSLVIWSFQKETSTSPGVRNRLKPTVMMSRNRMLRMPFTIYRKGTWERPITSARNSAAATYPRGPW